MRCGAQDLGVYVSAYRRTGFASTLNWYRTSRENWDDEANVPMVVPHPALMVTAGRDRVLRPALSEGMEAYVPNLKRAVGRTVVRRSAPSQVSLTRHGAGGPVSFFFGAHERTRRSRTPATGSATSSQLSLRPCSCGGSPACLRAGYKPAGVGLGHGITG